MVQFRQTALAVCFTLIASGAALANCGDLNGDQQVTATDALTSLQIAVGVAVPVACSCDDCTAAQVPSAPAHCTDVDGDGSTTALDAFAITLVAVGAEAELGCTCDACEGIATTTTSTTSPDCLAEDALDGRSYNRKTKCPATFGELYNCDPPTLYTDAIRFEHLGDGAYDVKSASDGRHLYFGTLGCASLVIPWVGTWNFEGTSSFSGAGGLRLSCTYTGAEEPAVPPNPPAASCTPTPRPCPRCPYP